MGAAATGAFCGDNLSYFLGRQGGHRLLEQYGHLIHVGRRRRRLTEFLFNRYGGPVVTLGRFIPVVHIWTAFPAGTNVMPWYRFLPFDAAGCTLWAVLLGGIGYALGRTAERIGGIITALSVPLALAIAVVALLVLRSVEGRLQRHADEAIDER